MLFDFLRGGTAEGNLDHVLSRSVAMLADARHSFDLATLALLADADAGTVADDIRATDARINQTEYDLRSELIVHVTVRGTLDIGTVLALTILLKKIERIGDQAKNVLDLAESGVHLSGLPEHETLLAERRVASDLFAEAGELLGAPSTTDEEVETFDRAVRSFMETLEQRLDAYMTSDRPGHELVPLAIYDRYVRRIVANLAGVVRTSAEPIELSSGGRPDDDED